MAEEKEEKYLDHEGFGGGKRDVLSFEQLTMEQVRRCIIIGSEEMTGGHYKEEIVVIKGVAHTKEVYVPDIGQKFINCVTTLNNMLAARIGSDTEEKLKINAIENVKTNYFNELLTGKISKEKYRYLKIELYRMLFVILNNYLHKEGYFKDTIEAEQL